MTGTLPRTFWSALKSGLLWRCPACGKGALYKSYMKQADICTYCKQDMTDVQVDDGPAALVILIAGVPMVPLAILVTKYPPGGSEIFSVFFLIAAMALLIFFLLPSIKGALIAAKWHNHSRPDG